jgi:diguanylate cyclase (GGDEF)-like protein/PAS domain S-box-containing protein
MTEQTTEQSQVTQLVDAIALPMGRWARDGRLTYCNHHYEAWTGKSRAQLLGKTLPEIFGVAAWAIARQPFAKALAGESVTYERQVILERGEPRWHRVMVFPDNPGGVEPESIFTIAFDIEDDIRLRQQLASNEARLRSVLESIDIPIARISPQRVLMYTNSSYAKLMGFEQNALPGTPIADVIGSDIDLWVTPFYERASRGESVSYDRHFTNFDPPRWIRVRLQPERDASGLVRSIVASLYDIDADVSERIKLELARKRLDEFTNSIPFSLAYVDSDLRYRFANREFLRRHGLQSSDILGRHPRDARGEDTWKKNQPYFEAALRGEVAHHERPIRLASGEERWTRTIYAPDQDDLGTIRGVYTTSFDIHELKQAQSEISRVDAKLSAHLARSPVAVVEYDRFGTIVQWSRRAEALLGVSADTMIGTKLTLDFVHPNDQAAVGDVIKRILAGGSETVINTHRYRHRSGRYVWIEWYTSIIRTATGQIESIMSLGVDRTERTEARLRLQRLADQVPNPVTYVGLDMRYVFMNTAFTAWTGITREQMIGRTPKEVRGEELGEAFERSIRRALSGIATESERCATLVGGEVRWVKTLFSPDFDDHGRVVGCYNVSFDVHESKLREESLRLAAAEDPLTGLLTRRALFDRLDTVLRRSEVSSVAVFFVDLDGFKAVNDDLGHAMGDIVLIQAANALSQGVRPLDIVGRFGGDEFLVVAIDTDEKDCEKLAASIISSISAIECDGSSHHQLGASIGVAVARLPIQRDSDDLVRRADRAMYEVKRTGGGKLRFAP